MKWYPRACPACGGDLHDDLEDPAWLQCLMCGRAFRARAPAVGASITNKLAQVKAELAAEEQPIAA